MISNDRSRNHSTSRASTQCFRRKVRSATTVTTTNTLYECSNSRHSSVLIHKIELVITDERSERYVLTHSTQPPKRDRGDSAKNIHNSDPADSTRSHYHYYIPLEQRASIPARSATEYGSTETTHVDPMSSQCQVPVVGPVVTPDVGSAVATMGDPILVPVG